MTSTPSDEAENQSLTLGPCIPCTSASEAGPTSRVPSNPPSPSGYLLNDGIGDTIRVSLVRTPVEEVKVGTQIRKSLGLHPRRLEIVSCPFCGRAQVGVYTHTTKVQAAFDGFPIPVCIAPPLDGNVLTLAGPGNRVLDADSGRSGTSFRLQARFGCFVDGVNFAKYQVDFAAVCPTKEGTSKPGRSLTCEAHQIARYPMPAPAVKVSI